MRNSTKNNAESDTVLGTINARLVEIIDLLNGDSYSFESFTHKYTIFELHVVQF